jgi:hypothetical protein
LASWPAVRAAGGDLLEIAAAGLNWEVSSKGTGIGSSAAANKPADGWEPRNHSHQEEQGDVLVVQMDRYSWERDRRSDR